MPTGQYQHMISPTHEQEKPFTFQVSSPTSTTSSPSHSRTPSSSLNRPTSSSAPTTPSLQKKMMIIDDSEGLSPKKNHGWTSEPMDRVRQNTASVEGNDNSLKVSKAQVKRSSISLADSDITKQPIHAKHMYVTLANGSIVDIHIQIQKKNFTTHVTWTMSGAIQHVIHLSHGNIFGTRKLFLDDKCIHDSRKLVDDGSSHAIIVDPAQHKLMITIHLSKGHFEYILLVNDTPLTPASGSTAALLSPP